MQNREAQHIRRERKCAEESAAFAGKPRAKPEPKARKRPREATPIGVNYPVGKPQRRNNVHYRYKNASHPLFVGVRRTSSLKKWVNASKGAAKNSAPNRRSF